jgi:hypothetical protein
MDREADLREGTGIRGSVTLLTKCLLSISMIMSMIDLIAIGTRSHGTRSLATEGSVICRKRRVKATTYYWTQDCRAAAYSICIWGSLVTT